MTRYSVLLVLLVLLCAFAAVAQDTPLQITTGDKRDADPMVSPDGKHLAFASNRTGSFNIFLLTFGKAGVVQLTQSKKDDRHPSWTPDSKTVLFNSKRTGADDLYEMAYDGGSGFLQLTDRPDIEQYASSAPRGSGILFATCPKKTIQFKNKMNIVFAEDRGAANQARFLGEGDEPRFSPDGSKIVFMSKRTKNWDIWIMNADGGLQTQLTTDPKDDENPCFSPDGKQIVFASNRTGNYELWVMGADGSNQRQLTSDPADDTQPCWSVGGYLYYTKETSNSQSTLWRLKAP